MELGYAVHPQPAAAYKQPVYQHNAPAAYVHSQGPQSLQQPLHVQVGNGSLGSPVNRLASPNSSAHFAYQPLTRPTTGSLPPASAVPPPAQVTTPQHQQHQQQQQQQRLEEADDSDRKTNPRYANMSEAEVTKKMKRVVYIWSFTQLFGSFAMPAWIAGFATQYYTAMNLGPGEVAMVVTLSKCIDVLTDPLMACYLRKCTMRKITHIAVYGALIQAVAFIAMFFPFKPIDPEGGRSRVLLQYTVCYIMFFIGDTLQGTPTTTLGTMLKSQRILDEAHHNDGLRMGSMMKVVGILNMGFMFFIIGAAMSSAGAEMGVDDGVMAGNKPRTNLIVSIIVGSLHVIINVVFAATIKGYNDSTVSKEFLKQLETTSFLRQFSEMMTSAYNNPFFRQLIGAWMCDQLTLTLMKNLLMWFVRHKVEPEMAKGCDAYNDPANFKYRDDGGFESGMGKVDFECKASNVMAMSVFFLIIGAIVGNVFWQKKLDREKDRYGNRNLYQNWLLFNLSAAVTNGLMVFVGRGDTRLFWFLCFVNGIPIGGEFLTDTILLFLIGGETWLSRNDKKLTQAEEAEQLDLHTTKFSMMKTFIPKAVSLVAEALPLALIQIWYREPREICRTEAVPPITDINSVACAKYLSYPEGNGFGGHPRFIPQKPQVTELISFFFFILPTVTCLVSYYIKSRFQITDTGEIVMLNSLSKGVPSADTKRPSYIAANPLSPTKKGEVVSYGDKLTKLGVEQIHRAVCEFLDKHKYGGLPAMPAGQPGVLSDATYRATLDKDTVDGFIHQLQSACDINPEEIIPMDGRAISTSQSLSSITLPKPISDEWVGGIIPTTHSQHIFKLPTPAHMFTKLPLYLVEFITRDPSSQTWKLPSWLRHTQLDTETVSAVKGAVHGLLAVVLVPLYLLMKLVQLTVTGGVYFCRRCVPGLRDENAGRYGPDVSLFGVVGKRSLHSFTDRILPVLAAHIIAPGDASQASLIRNSVLCWLNAARSRGMSGTAFQHRENRLLSPQGEPVQFINRKLYLEHRIIARIVYMKTLGFSVMIAMLSIISVIFAMYGKSIFTSQWTIAVTMPLFLSAIGLVTGLYFQGLYSLTKPAGDGKPAVLDPSRPLDGAGLAVLGMVQYNSHNRACGNPLVYSETSTDFATLLNGLGTPVRVRARNEFGQVADDGSRGPSSVLSYMMYVPAQSVRHAVKMLEPVHRVLDQIEAEANRRRSATGPSQEMVKWGVANILSHDDYAYYRCFLYTWEGVSPPFIARTSSADRKAKVD